MDLLTRLKQSRARPKEPFRRSSFTVVSALVRRYNLDQQFLDNLKGLSFEKEWVLSQEPRAKEPGGIPPFSLASAEEYHLTREILAALDNPYLRYASSPEELLHSLALYRLNPGLEPEVLARVHFLTLLAREFVHLELSGLERGSEEDSGVAPARRAALQRLLDRLNTFINETMSGNLNT